MYLFSKYRYGINNKPKNFLKYLFFVGTLKAGTERQGPESNPNLELNPDPESSGTDPQIRIRIKTSRTGDTAYYDTYLFAQKFTLLCVMQGGDPGCWEPAACGSL